MYNVGIPNRQKNQQVWGTAPSTKALFKGKDETLPSLPTSHLPSDAETDVLPPPSGHPYLWIGMSGEWALEYKSAKKAKNTTIDTVENSVRVVTPVIKDTKQLKLYGLMGSEDIKTPCTIHNDLVFYFSEFSHDIQASGSRRDMQSRWTKAILEQISNLCGDRLRNRDTQSLESFDAVDVPICSDISLANRINNAINVYVLAPDSKVLQSLLDHLEHEFPSLRDPPPPPSLIIFFDFGIPLDPLDVPVAVYEFYGSFIADTHTQIQNLEPQDKRPAAYYLAYLVQDQLNKEFDIVLPVVEIMKIRVVLRDQGLFLPFALIRAFFAHASRMLQRVGCIDVSDCFLDVTEIARLAAPPASVESTASEPSQLAWANLVRSIHTILIQLVAQEKTQ